MNVIRRLSQVLMTSFCLFALAACAAGGAQPDARATANAQEDIAQLHAAYMKAFNAKDPVALANTYTEDTIFMPPNEPAVKTQLGVQNYSRMLANSPITGLLLNVTETEVVNGWAYCSGYYSLLGPNGSVMDRGKFLEVIKQTDQGWKIHRDIYNSDMPLPGSAPAAGTAMAPAAATH